MGGPFAGLNPCLVITAQGRALGGLAAGLKPGGGFKAEADGGCRVPGQVFGEFLGSDAGQPARRIKAATQCGREQVERTIGLQGGAVRRGCQGDEGRADPGRAAASRGPVGARGMKEDGLGVLAGAEAVDAEIDAIACDHR